MQLQSRLLQSQRIEKENEKTEGQAKITELKDEQHRREHDEGVDHSSEEEEDLQMGKFLVLLIYFVFILIFSWCSTGHTVRKWKQAHAARNSDESDSRTSIIVRSR